MMRQIFFGIDIGGTKIATSVGELVQDDIRIIEKKSFLTISGGFKPNIETILVHLQTYKKKHGAPISVGVSCGGPLDRKMGRILSPPNLPGWDRVPIVQILKKNLHADVYLENDANACALAEFYYGAGKQTNSMIFLTFGTGMGSGIILNGNLYRGASDCAGEVGHIRLAENGPVGYGKEGSFEGFCSGGGLAQLGRMVIEKHIAKSTASDWALQNASNDKLSAKNIVMAARKGDPCALEVMKTCGSYLGRGLSVLIDIINPDIIVIGSIYERAGDLLAPYMKDALKDETLPENLSVCRIVSSKLGEYLGEFGALCVAINPASK